MWLSVKQYIVQKNKTCWQVSWKQCCAFQLKSLSCLQRGIWTEMHILVDEVWFICQHMIKQNWFCWLKGFSVSRRYQLVTSVFTIRHKKIFFSLYWKLVCSITWTSTDHILIWQIRYTENKENKRCVFNFDPKPKMKL